MSDRIHASGPQLHELLFKECADQAREVFVLAKAGNGTDKLVVLVADLRDAAAVEVVRICGGDKQADLCLREMANGDNGAFTCAMPLHLHTAVILDERLAEKPAAGYFWCCCMAGGETSITQMPIESGPVIPVTTRLLDDGTWLTSTSDADPHLAEARAAEDARLDAMLADFRQRGHAKPVLIVLQPDVSE